MSKVALVTGAGSGIGSAIALRLASEGFAVGVFDLNAGGVESVERVILERGGSAVSVQGDVTKREDVFHAVERTAAEFGGFDVMVNNAGIGPAKPILDSNQEDFDRIMHVNVLSVLWGIQAAADKFKSLGRGGKIVNAVSQAGHRGDGFVPLYAASKFAVRGLTQSAAMALAKDNITVNGYCPGLVDTPMWRSISDELAKSEGRRGDEVRAEQVQRIALGRYQTPEDVAAFVSFLAGPDSNYLTGQSVLIDGGMVFV
ncbi:acetoin reductase [Arthrobacter sp. TES]|uniref:acetoin reductase n=1 Tax=Paenarthrobacter ureafaciens TaxID=37931 RepID=UPI0003969D09|nr:Diacetyl reductase [Arthrobacter sp. ZXY-2]ERI37230.1 acetoin reductase [Arthrobacter sp. AK-YN10]QOI62066.1 acetoin reductase [Arthrobacter sp. TES]